MRLRTRKSPLLLLLAASTAALAVQSAGDAISADDLTVAPRDGGTRDAPVDGKDGKPHAGPFIDLDSSASSPTSSDELPRLKDRPVDPTVQDDGTRIPEHNDGVMNDRGRAEPEEGTTGTGGGVTEKDKARKLQESVTGEKVGNVPQTPKEQPPLSYADEVASGGGAAAGGEDASGFEVCFLSSCCWRWDFG